MYNSEDIRKMLEQSDYEMLPKIVEKLIADHKGQSEKMLKYYKRYTGETVPIQSRPNKDKAGVSVNNRIHADYEGIIIDEIKGYVWGNAIKVSYRDDNTETANKVNDEIENLRVLNNLDSLDEETGELSSICGYAGRLLYYDKEGNLKIMNTKPWETIFVINNSTDLIDYALIYYPWDIVDIKTGQIKKTIKVEWYDSENIYYLVKDGGKYKFENIDEPEYKNPQRHLFKFTPVIKFKANNLEQSDLEKVTPLIDAYDELISDAQNEIQEFVHAYLKTTGAEITAEERIALRKSGIINLPDKDADADFLIKNINGDFFEQQKKTVKEEIFNTSKTVNMSDEKFSAGGVESGEARKWKLLALEFKAITKERKFTEGLRNMWRVITSSPESEYKFDYTKLSFVFIRNLPIDFLYYSEVANKMLGIIPKLDILTYLPFVKNPQDSLERLQTEQEVNLDTVPTDEEINKKVQDILNNNGN